MKFKISIFLMFLFINLQSFGQIKIYEKFADFEKVHLKNLSDDTTYIVNFWATWCAPCVKELPIFDSFNTKYKGRKIKMVLVSLDDPDILESRIKPLLIDKKIETEVVVLADGKTYKWIDLIDPSWSGAIPITLILKGNKKHFYEKDYENLEELESDVIKINNYFNPIEK